MDSLEITTLLNTVANLIAVNMSSEEIAFCAALFTQLGDTLATITFVQNNNEEKPDTH